MSKLENIYLAHIGPEGNFDAITTLIECGYLGEYSFDALLCTLQSGPRYTLANQVTMGTRSFLRFISAAHAHHIKVLIDLDLAGVDLDTSNLLNHILECWHNHGVDGICLQNLFARPNPATILANCRQVFGDDRLIIAHECPNPMLYLDCLSTGQLDYIYHPQTPDAHGFCRFIDLYLPTYQTTMQHGLLHFHLHTKPIPSHANYALSVFCLMLGTAMVFDLPPVSQEPADFKDLMKLRVDSPIFAAGTFRLYHQYTKRLYVYERRISDTKKALIICSLLGRRKPVYLPYNAPIENLRYSNYPPSEQNSWRYLLRPYESRIFVWDE